MMLDTPTKRRGRPARNKAAFAVLYLPARSNQGQPVFWHDDPETCKQEATRLNRELAQRCPHDFRKHGKHFGFYFVEPGKGRRGLPWIKKVVDSVREKEEVISDE